MCTDFNEFFKNGKIREFLRSLKRYATNSQSMARLDTREKVLGSTQPCIPPGSLNRVPASAGVRAGVSPLPGGRWQCVIPCGMWVPVAVHLLLTYFLTRSTSVGHVSSVRWAHRIGQPCQNDWTDRVPSRWQTGVGQSSHVQDVITCTLAPPGECDELTVRRRRCMLSLSFL